MPEQVRATATWDPIATMRHFQRFLWQKPLPAVAFQTLPLRWIKVPRGTLTACWKSMDMPMLSSTCSVGMLSFLHSSSRRDSNTWQKDKCEIYFIPPFSKDAWKWLNLNISAKDYWFLVVSSPVKIFRSYRVYFSKCSCFQKHKQKKPPKNKQTKISHWKRKKRTGFLRRLCFSQVQVGLRKVCGFWKLIFFYPYKKSSEEGHLSWQPVLQQHFTKMLPKHASNTPVLGPRYLEVWIWSLTKIMAKTSYGHEPHEFQAGALGIYVFHHGYCLWRQKAMFTFTKRNRRHLYQHVWSSQRKALFLPLP